VPLAISPGMVAQALNMSIHHGSDSLRCAAPGLAGNVTLTAPQPRPPSTRRAARDDRDVPRFGHGRDATPTPATPEYGAAPPQTALWLVPLEPWRLSWCGSCFWRGSSLPYKSGGAQASSRRRPPRLGRQDCPSLCAKHATAHTLRHSCAMTCYGPATLSRSPP
jgi:hypothetical protein